MILTMVMMMGGGHHIHAHNVPGTMLKAFHEVYQVSLTATLLARAAALASLKSGETLVLKGKAMCPWLHFYEATEMSQTQLSLTVHPC